MEQFFLEPEEIRGLGLEKKGQQKTDAGGIDLLSDGFNRVIAVGEENCMVVGITASGKTRSNGIELLENLIDAEESFISVDAKNTSYRYTFNYAKDAGYKTFILNLRDPLKSQFWNPLGHLWKLYHSGDFREKDKAIRGLLDMGNCIFQVEENEAVKDLFWIHSARSLFVAVCLALFIYGKEEQATLYNAYKMVVEGDRKIVINSVLKIFFEEMIGTNTEAYQYASGYILAPNETRGGILSTYLDKMTLFAGLSVRNLLSHAGFEMSDIKDDEKVGIYVILPDENRNFHQIGAMFIKMLYQHYLEMAESRGGFCRKRFNFVIDEFGNMYIPDAEMMFSAIRSRNGRIYIFLQTLEQLFSQYGKEKGTTIKDNCGLQYYYATSNLTTLRELEELSGQYRGIDENGIVYMQHVLPAKEIQELPKRYALVRYHGKQYISFFPDISEYHVKLGEYADFQESEILPLEEFDIYHIVAEYKKEKAIEESQKMKEQSSYLSDRPIFPAAWDRSPSLQYDMSFGDIDNEKEDKEGGILEGDEEMKISELIEQLQESLEQDKEE